MRSAGNPDDSPSWVLGIVQLHSTPGAVLCWVSWGFLNVCTGYHVQLRGPPYGFPELVLRRAPSSGALLWKFQPSQHLHTPTSVSQLTGPLCSVPQSRKSLQTESQEAIGLASVLLLSGPTVPDCPLSSVWQQLLHVFSFQFSLFTAGGKIPVTPRWPGVESPSILCNVYIDIFLHIKGIVSHDLIFLSLTC